jgi:hypothetical protein
MKNKITPLVLFGLLQATSNAAVYASNFDSPPYTPGANLNGLDGWVLNGASLSDVALVDTSPFPTPPSSGGQALHFGFQEIDASQALLLRPGGISLAATRLQATFTIQDSDTSTTFTNRDDFTFTFRGPANENLLTIRMSPTLQDADPTQSIRVDQFSWSSDFALGASNFGILGEGDYSILDILFSPSGVNDVDFSLKTAGLEFASGTLAGAGSQFVSTWGFEWIPLDPDNEGSNILIVDDLSLSIIPEPSSSLAVAMLLGIGILVRSRRC